MVKAVEDISHLKSFQALGLDFEPISITEDICGNKMGEIVACLFWSVV